MNMVTEKLKLLGFNTWFESSIDADKLDAHEVARVISVRKDSYIISKGESEAFAELSGKLAYTSDSATDFPTTGDWVLADFYDDGKHAIIHYVVTRKSLIQRKSAGKAIDYQLIAANVDVAFIVQSVDYNFNLGRLERYLVMIKESNITPVILLSKSDLKPSDEINSIIASAVTIAPDITVLPFSNESGDTIEEIKNQLTSGHTYCLLGSSGVGKTTLLNNILGNTVYETNTVSKKDSKGRHTTTSRELVRLESGAMIIDTPGMRELGNISVDAGIDETFSEIITLSMKCRFRNCNHINEKGCAILSAIEHGQLSEKRYKNYTKMKSESAFNEMSFLEKKKKDKDFGKLVKSAVDKKIR